MAADGVDPSVPTPINRVEITGQLAKLEPVRYSPSGVPVVKMVLSHDSWQPDGDHHKRVQCQVTVQVQGETHQPLITRLKVGDWLLIQGFLQRNAYREDQSWLKVQALSVEQVVAPPA